MENSIMRLLKEIAKEDVKLSIKYDEEHDDLIFIFCVNGEEYKEILKHSDTEQYEDQSVLMSYVLAEILSIIRGLKEEAQTE